VCAPHKTVGTNITAFAGGFGGFTDIVATADGHLLKRANVYLS
jgi:hypothetical protein